MKKTPSNMDSKKAEVRENKTISAIWIIPFLALCIGLWMVFQQWQSQGPTITISLQSAEGLEANKTQIKRHNVSIGIVKTINLNKDVDGVIVTAQIDKKVAHFLNEDTQIWVVSPRISNAGISGLHTILSGVYIELAPGKNATPKSHFTALENPPVTPAGTPGIHITLSNKEAIAYSVGDTVMYRGITVGRFEDVYFNITDKTTHYNVFINSPYHQIITKNTRFWNVSGLQVDLSADGINVRTSSIQSLLTNSVTFDDPEGLPAATMIDSRSYFDIYPDRESAITPVYQHSAEYIILVSSSVRGLSVGAPVEYRGINVGEVISVNYIPENNKPEINQTYKIPVLISIQPAKFGRKDSQQAVDRIKELVAAWIKTGLRAKLKTGNVLTGQLFIELQHYPDEPAVDMTHFDKFPVIPNILDDFSLLAQRSGQLLNKFNNLPVEELTSNATNMMKTFDELANSLKNTSANLTLLLDQANKQQLIANLNSTLSSASKLADTYSLGSPSHTKINNTLTQLNASMSAAETLITDYSEGSESNEMLIHALEAINGLMREIQPLLLQLHQQPNSLIFSGQQPPNIQPEARK